MEELDGKNHECVLTKAECARIFDQMMLSLDGELSFEEEHELMNDIHKHPCCLQKFELEKSYKEFLCSKLVRKQVSPTLIASIKNKVREIGYQPRV